MELLERLFSDSFLLVQNRTILRRPALPPQAGTEAAAIEFGILEISSELAAAGHQ
jgi:hypothetical protein